MGTPDFAVPSLTALIENAKQSGWSLVGVVTQPDRPSGRGRQLTPPPVKVVAQAGGLKVIQPETLKAEAALAALSALQPDLIIVAAFGQILRKNVLELPARGCLNVHASLLPRWRGAAPVAAAIRAGDSQTGVTIMQMEEGLDTGPMLAKRAIPIRPDHTTETLTAELAELGADLLVETLAGWLAGNIRPEPQDASQATLAPRLKKEEGEIDWTQSVAAIERQVRAFYPWPGTFTVTSTGPLKILETALAPAVAGPPGAEPGLLFKEDRTVYVATGSGVLQLLTVQPAGKRAMPAEAMLNGQPELLGTRLGLSH